MQTIVITDAASGIGYAVAQALAAKSNRVIGVGKKQDKCDKAVRQIIKAVPDGNIKFFCGDLSRQTEVYRVADEISAYLKEECGGRLDVLINYAGISKNWHAMTMEGYEFQFALNHVAGFLMTHRLMPYMQKNGSRIIMTGIGVNKSMKIRWKNFIYKKHYQCITSYEQTKLCNLLFVKEFNRRYAQSMRAYVVDPGFNNMYTGSTHSIRGWVWAMYSKFSTSHKATVQTYEFLCKKTPAPKGVYYYRCSETQLGQRMSETESKRYFELSEKICGIEFALSDSCS